MQAFILHPKRERERERERERVKNETFATEIKARQTSFFLYYDAALPAPYEAAAVQGQFRL